MKKNKGFSLDPKEKKKKTKRKSHVTKTSRERATLSVPAGHVTADVLAMVTLTVPTKKK